MKIKYKNLFIFIFIIILTIFLIYYFLIKNNADNKSKEKESYSYSSATIKKFEKLKIKDKVDLKTYNKTLEVAVNSDLFNSSYTEYYNQIKYFENDRLIEYINILAKQGLAINEINEIFDHFINYQNFNINNAKRYLSYSYKNDIEYKDVVTRINLNLDKPYYTDTKRIEKQDDIYALVNKYNYLDESYVPSNLKSLFNISSLKMVDVAADAYKEFINAAKKDGITLIGTTAYRSASRQKSLYNSYVNRDGKEKADTYSARPGYSEHQLGYSVDLNDPTFTGKRLSDADYKWIKENCYKYGFIIRYPENKENITGYMHENWHIRYVGIDVATKIHDLDITFDEYYDLYIAKH